MTRAYFNVNCKKNRGLGMRFNKVAGALVVTLVLSSGTYRTEAQQPKVIGNWMVSVEADRFSDAANKVIAMTSNSGGAIFIVRCLSSEISFAISGETYKTGDQYLIKYRPDKSEVIDTNGVALSEKIIVMDTSLEMVRSLVAAKEYAFRVIGASSYDLIFKAGAGAPKALAEVTKACPLK